jgi:hypothetical protein
VTTLEVVALVHFAATVFMTGVIWFVQIVHYPLFAHVERSGFPDFQRAHESRTTRVVAPVMAIELAGAVALTLLGWTTLSRPLLVGLALLASIWLSTALLQVPRHRILGTGFDERAHRLLVTSNWIRTIAWTVRAPLSAFFLLEVLGG